MKVENKKKTVKAYKNLDFLQTPDARTIRVLCELMEPQTRLRRHNIENTIVFFGSARANPKSVAEHNFSVINELYKSVEKPDRKLIKAYEDAKKEIYLSEFYEKSRELAYKLTKWILSLSKKKNSLVICTGGGSGIMEAANKGANEAGGKSLGFNISLPFEQKINDYISDDLAFEFHYFFIRKFWFAYLAKALVIFPGGFGTLDEMMEVFTLVQTHKIIKKMPIIIFGADYWKNIIDFEKMVKYQTISSSDLKLFSFYDDVDEAFEFLKKNLQRYVV